MIFAHCGRGADGLRLLGRTPARQRPGSAPHDVDDQGLDLFKAFLEVVMMGMRMITKGEDYQDKG